MLRAVEGDDGPPIGEDAIASFAWYLFEVTNLTPGDLEDLQMAFAKNLNQPHTLMSTAQRLRLEGHQQGLTQGLTKGLTQGRAEALLRLLAQRFGQLPPSVGQQVRDAADAELDRWLDRVLTAPTLADVFAG